MSERRLLHCAADQKFRSHISTRCSAESLPFRPTRTPPTKPFDGESKIIQPNSRESRLELGPSPRSTNGATETQGWIEAKATFTTEHTGSINNMPPKSEDTAKEDKELLRELGEVVVPQIALQLLRDGEISIHGKTEDQVVGEVVSYLRLALSEQKINFGIGIDHAVELLPEARKFLRLQKYELSALYFATYFEHRLNWLIVQICETKQIDAATIKQVLREASMRAKCTWIMVFLGYKPLSKEMLTALDQISDIRNAFVHFKWPTEVGDAHTSQRSREQTLAKLKKAESIVRYLRKFEEGHLYKGQGRQLLSALKKRHKSRRPKGNA
jgi:hypothetical protein